MLVRPVGLIITPGWQVDMSDKMVNIDGNLDQVKRNLEYLEEMYDTVFRKVNRLFVDVEI